MTEQTAENTAVQVDRITYTPIGGTQPRELVLDINAVRGTDAIETEKRFGMAFDKWGTRLSSDDAMTEDVLWLIYLLRRRQHADGCAGEPCRGCLEPDLTFEDAADIPLASLVGGSDADDPKDSSSGSEHVGAHASHTPAS